jgi:hypothetical protein
MQAGKSIAAPENWLRLCPIKICRASRQGSLHPTKCLPEPFRNAGFATVAIPSKPQTNDLDLTDTTKVIRVRNAAVRKGLNCTYPPMTSFVKTRQASSRHTFT